VIVSDAGKPFAIDELDNYATHKHPKVLAWLARHPRWSFHFTPTSASWLNAVENFFSKMTRQRIRRGVFRSIADLQAAINAYLAEHNTSPKPSSGPNPPTPFWPRSMKLTAPATISGLPEPGHDQIRAAP
jgi:hypothetical protein